MVSLTMERKNIYIISYELLRTAAQVLLDASISYNIANLDGGDEFSQRFRAYKARESPQFNGSSD